MKIPKQIKSKTVVGSYQKDNNLYLYECADCTGWVEEYDNYCSECGSALKRDILKQVPDGV